MRCVEIGSFRVVFVIVAVVSLVWFVQVVAKKLRLMKKKTIFISFPLLIVDRS